MKNIKKVNIYFIQISSPTLSPSSLNQTETRPVLKKRPIRTESRVLFTPPVYKSIEITTELQILKSKAKKGDTLKNVNVDKLEQLLCILYQEKKLYATNHQFKEGHKCNNAIEFVKKYHEIAKRKENQDNAKEEFAEINKQFEDSFKEFDVETKKLEKDLLKKQENKRTDLLNLLNEELDNFDARWNSDKKQRLYNRSTNNLNTLRRQLSLLLVDSRFADAQVVQKQVNERTKIEQDDHYQLMKNDHDTSLRLLKEKQLQELQYFDEKCSVEIEIFRQNRKRLRQGYLNRQLKLKTKENIMNDPNKLWAHRKTERVGNNLKSSTNSESLISPSSKIKRSDIKESDAVILTLPPLNHRNSPRKKFKKKT